MTPKALTTVAALASTMAVASAPAQAVDSVPRTEFAVACSSGLPGGGPTCPFDRRLALDLQAQGSGAPPQLRGVVDVGASAAAVFALPLASATARDSLFYAVVEVERDAAGTYRIETRLAGPRAPAAACRGSMTGHLDDLTFGAFLATQVAQLVRCAHARRPAGG